MKAMHSHPFIINSTIVCSVQAGRGNALPAKIFSVNLDDLYIQGDKGKLTKVRE